MTTLTETARELRERLEADASEWKAPTSKVDAYMKGDVVRYDGNLYVSDAECNTTEPTSKSWHRA